MAKEKQKKKKKHKKSVIVLKALFIILLVLIILLGVFIGYSTLKNGWGVSGIIKTVVGYDEEKLKDLDEFRVMILGVSTDISVKLTDTIIVASYNPKTQQASLLSVPRDTFVGKNESNANSYNKINALYQSGIEKTLAAVNDITNLGIEYYIVVETEALRELVNKIGGVEFDVPINMDYDDTSQDLHIHLKAGPQTLNGEQAEGLVRFRHNNNGTSYPASYGDNDIGRMKTQRAFITQVVKQTIQLKNVTKLGELLDIAYKYVKTNISLSVAKDYIPYLLDFDTENIRTGTVPGTPAKINGLWFYKYNKTETAQMVSELFEYNEETNSQTDEEKIQKNSKIKIELINGSGTDSTLSAVKTLLEKQGYKVSKTSTVSATQNTVIINNKKINNDTLKEIQEQLNVGVIQNADNNANQADITIILGANYNK